MIQEKLAMMATGIDAARLLVYNAAYQKDAGKKRFSKESAMCKLFAASTAVEVTKEAVQIFGGYGYTKDYPVERYFRDAKCMEIYEGTSEIQKIVIARSLLG
jgi:alkylation response protein AidB-like acyl-CoA dehydrogenase